MTACVPVMDPLTKSLKTGVDPIGGVSPALLIDRTVLSPGWEHHRDWPDVMSDVWQFERDAQGIGNDLELGRDVLLGSREDFESAGIVVIVVKRLVGDEECVHSRLVIRRQPVEPYR
jgi:hypothetical protein